MIRFILLLLVVVVAAIGIAWYSAQTLPSWYQQQGSKQTQTVERLVNKINREGVGSFLGDKFADVMNGQLVLSEVEFNALLLSSLQSNRDGRRVLEVSDAVNAQIRNGELEVGVVIDLNKVAAINNKTRKTVEDVVKALPLLDQSKVFMSVTGLPIARNGNIAFDSDFSINIGSIPVSSSLLAKLGVPIHKTTETSFPLKYVAVKSITLVDDEIVLGVFPKF